MTTGSYVKRAKFAIACRFKAIRRWLRGEPLPTIHEIVTRTLETHHDELASSLMRSNPLIDRNARR